MSDNWIVQNLQNALDTWNEKLAEIWQIITQSPQDFKGGAIWNVITNIHGTVQAIGLALLVLFFVIGVMHTCGSFSDIEFDFGGELFALMQKLFALNRLKTNNSYGFTV